jgi:hypothetical protein
MYQSTIAAWSYYVGCVCATTAIIYRVLWFSGLGARVFGAAPNIVPHNFLDFSILCFVISIASNARAVAPR